MRQSEARYRTFFESSPDGIYVLDSTGTIVDLNPATARMHGYTRAEIIGRHISELVSHEHAPRLPAELSEIRAGTPYERDWKLRRKDGSVFVASVTSIAMPNGDLLGIARDTTERTQAEQQMQTLIESMPDGVLVVDSEGIISVANLQAEVLFGYPRQELLGQPIEMLLPERIRAIHPKHRAGFMAGPMRRNMGSGLELYARRKDGSEFPVDISLNTMASGQGSRAIAVIRDVTERKQAEEAFRKSQEQYRSALDNMLEGCQILGFDWRYVYVNAEAERHNNRPTAELLGKRYMDMWPGVESTEVFRVIRRSMEERIVQHMQNEFIFPDGARGWFELDIQPIPEGVLILSADITQRKRAEQRIETQMHHLAALSAIDTAITGSLDLRITLNVVLEQTVAELGMDAACVLLLNPHTQTLAFAAGRGFRDRAIEQSRARLGEGLAGKAALERHRLHVHNPHQSPDFTRAALLADEGFVEYYAVPMAAKGKVVGVLEVFHRSSYEADGEWHAFFETLAGRAAIAVDSAQLFEDLQRSNVNLSVAYDATIEGWSRAMDLRDKETEGHTQRVTEMALKLARAAGMSEEQLVHVRRGALLHDIGKMGVPDGILLKPGKLTDEEWVVMHRHPELAFEMLAPINYLRPALDIPASHHEKWDGSGYARGLKGEQIPLAARLFAVVDVYDALRSDRPYRKAWPKDKVIEHVKAGSGTHFDPKAVELFLEVISEDTQHAG